MQFSPKILELNAEFFGTVLGSPETDFFGLLLVHVCCLCVIANMNNMLVVCKFCYYMCI